MAQYDPIKVEPEVMSFWEKANVYANLKDRNKKGKNWTFLQGPPYTSGKLHMGHAWNHALKDMALRYRRMAGFNVWDRAGYDMHGLPTEHKVQEKFGLKDKEAIAKFGFERFAKECETFSTEMAKLMDKDLLRSGVWMDYSDPYYPITNEFMETEWWFVKKAHENKRLYQSERTLSWCASCATALAKHEQEYKEVTDNSIFLKFKVKDKDEFLIIWTTTPWTIPLNLAIMVNPDVEYVRAKVEGETWVVAKVLANVFIAGLLGKKFEILESFTGDKLEGTEYVHPWLSKIPALAKLKSENPKVHTVLLSTEYVDTSAGSGLVHCAPGCGPEDFEIGYRNGLPPFNTVNENGLFDEESGIFKGMQAKTDDKKIVKIMEEDGFLIASTPIKHEYAHCERCRNPIIFRKTKQWFFKAEDLVPLMLENNESVRWVPKQMGDSFRAWITNLRDNSITKQRVWGTPVPIWQCSDKKCGELEVIGSIAELKKKATTAVPESLHKPWIDGVLLRCPKCGKDMKRFEDIIDVWVDSGVTQWACFYYPQREDLIKDRFPLDMVLEGKEHVRLWFYMLTLCQAIVTGKRSFANVYCTGMLQGVDGVKMSKSLGNIISPYSIIDKHGADTMRFYLSTIDAGNNVAFSWKEIENRKRSLMVLWNLQNLVLDLAQNSGFNPAELDAQEMRAGFDIPEEHLASLVESATLKVTKFFEEYELDDVPRVAERLILDTSRVYVQMVRDKTNDDEGRVVVLFAAFSALVRSLQLLAPVCPFITESIYRNLRSSFGAKGLLKEESIHMTRWPKANESAINKQLEDDMAVAQDALQAALAARDKSGLGIRWPLQRLTVVLGQDSARNSLSKMKDIVANMANVKSIEIASNLPDIKEVITVNRAAVGQGFGSSSKEVEAALAKSDLPKLVAEIRNSNKAKLKHLKGEAELNIGHFNITHETPKHLIEVQLPGGFAYLDITLTPELEAEGFSRELTRRIQQLRKEAGLTKNQKITCVVETALTDRLNPFVEAISQKVNGQLSFGKADGKHKADFKVKNESFSVAIDVA